MSEIFFLPKNRQKVVGPYDNNENYSIVYLLLGILFFLFNLIHLARNVGIPSRRRLFSDNYDVALSEWLDFHSLESLTKVYEVRRVPHVNDLKRLTSRNYERSLLINCDPLREYYNITKTKFNIGPFNTFSPFFIRFELLDWSGFFPKLRLKTIIYHDPYPYQAAERRRKGYKRASMIGFTPSKLGVKRSHVLVLYMKYVQYYINSMRIVFREFVSEYHKHIILVSYMVILSLLFLITLFLLLVYDPFYIGYNNLWVFNIGQFNIFFGYDGLTLLFWHFSLLIPLLCLANLADSVLFGYTDQYSFIFFISIGLVLTFSTLDLILFFIFFELLVLPFFYKMLRSSPRSRRYIAVFYLFFFTAISSLFFLFGLIIYFNFFGSSSILFSLFEIVLFDDRYSSLFGWFFIFSFLMKMPCFPFHTWLLEAHVEATTEGSVLLASLILKLSGYGFYRFVYGPYSALLVENSVLFSTLAFLGVCYCSLAAIRQTDIKRVLAYSSIVHMNMAFLSFFGMNDFVVLGGLLTMAGHTLVSALLFFVAGAIAIRGRVKNKSYYRGLLTRSPFLVYVTFVGFAGNMSFPGTCNFVGELYSFIGLALSGQYLLLFGLCIASFFCTFYSIYTFVTICYGNDGMSRFIDLCTREKIIFSFLTIYILFLGLFPKNLVNLFYNNMAFLCDISNQWLYLFPKLDAFSVLFSPVSVYFLQIDNWVIIAILLIVLSFGSNSFFGIISPFSRTFYVFFFFITLFLSPFSSFFSGGFSFLYVLLAFVWLVINYNYVHGYYSKYEDMYAALIVQFFTFSCMESAVSSLVVC
jgi:NADH-quinone oxidoreductase subunit M